MCGPLMWGFWWVFPFIGVFMCLAFLLMASRFAGTGRGFMCMGAHRHTPNGEPSESTAVSRTDR